MIDYVHESDSFELRELSRAVRRFAQAELTTNEYDRKQFSAMAELGLPAMSLHEEVGGSDIDAVSLAATIFEIARERLGPAIYLGVHLMVCKMIRTWSDHAHTTDLMRELASAEKLAAFCLTEPGAGSDASALITKAEPSDDGWVLNGEKIYITSGGVADIYIVFARTSEDQKNGISAFLVERDNPGISFGKPEKKMGCTGAPITSVTFENCQVPQNAQLGKLGDGYRIALSGLNSGRVSIAAAACGLASKSIELAVQHTKERKQFGDAVASFQGVQFMFADMCNKLHASILMTRHAAEEIDRGQKANGSASMAKCYATDAAMSITTDGVQLHGGAGYLEEYNVERLMRDAKMLQIVEGTNQIQRMLIARELLQE